MTSSILLADQGLLVHALEELTGLLVRCGDPEARSYPSVLLTRSIFGVDINPTRSGCASCASAGVVIEHDEVNPLRVPPLPNLDRHIRVGDALGGAAFNATTVVPGGARIARLRGRYSRASGSRKRTLERELERAERNHARAVLDAGIARCAAARRALLAAWRGRDLFGERYAPTSSERTEAQVLRVRSRDLRGRDARSRTAAHCPFLRDALRRRRVAWRVPCNHWQSALGALHRIPSRRAAAARFPSTYSRGHRGSTGPTRRVPAMVSAAQVTWQRVVRERSLELSCATALPGAAPSRETLAGPCRAR